MALTVARRCVMLVCSLIAIASCVGDKSKICSANGESYLCPEGTVCGAVQRLCIKPGGCGNGVVDDGEQCDDGNTQAGDGCSPTCQREVCGNGTLDPGEACDDGNTLGGDGCSADCKSREICGNGIVDRDAGEICDDGNTAGDDGCSADCKSTEVCGNYIIDRAVGEVCDDGPLGSTACSTSCRSNLTCGNFTVDTGEECDRGEVGENNAGGNADNTDCRHDCQFNRCGDGLIDDELGDRHEECDGGHLTMLVPNPTETVDCNIDCSDAHCGDGKVNRTAGEQCDDGNTIANDGCSPDCQFERCGNGVVDPQEECDGTAGLSPCNVDTCFQERCGNGVLDDDNRTSVHEECDDHNTADNDGCSSDCKREFCGDGIVNNGEVCDRALTPTTCNLDCTASSCGDHELNTSAGEQCDDGNNTDGDGCSATCTFEHCGNGVLDNGEECDGPLVGLQPCSATCHQERCGNGILDVDPANSVNEQCDLGAANADTGACTTTCQLARCGDSQVEAGIEQCDSGLDVNDDADCTSTCQLARCGDGLVDSVGPDHIEQCDDGAANTDNPTCPYNTTCTACSTQCVTATVHHQCGDGVVDAPDEVCDDHNTDACGSCSATCGTVTSARAFGFILTVTGADLADGTSLTLSDGINSPTVFEFDTDSSVATGHVAIAFSAGDTADQVRQAIQTAIQQQHAAGTLLIAPNVDPANTNPSLLLLGHDRPTSLGNDPIATDVAASAFVVAGMLGGQGGDCGDGVGCSSDDDCATHHCNAANVCETQSN